MRTVTYQIIYMTINERDEIMGVNMHYLVIL